MSEERADYVIDGCTSYPSREQVLEAVNYVTDAFNGRAREQRIALECARLLKPIMADFAKVSPEARVAMARGLYAAAHPYALHKIGFERVSDCVAISVEPHYRHCHIGPNGEPVDGRMKAVGISPAIYGPLYRNTIEYYVFLYITGHGTDSFDTDGAIYRRAAEVCERYGYRFGMYAQGPCSATTPAERASGE